MIPADIPRTNVGVVQACNPRPDHGNECYIDSYQFGVRNRPCKTAYNADGSGRVNLIMPSGRRVCLVLRPRD